jgi:integrase
MTIKAVLWTYDPRQDGSCNIKIYLNYKGKKKYIKTPFHVQPKDFDKKKGIVKKSHPNHRGLNARLGGIKMELESQLIANDDMSRVGEVKEESLIRFLESYVNDIKNGLTALRKSTGNSYNSLLTRLKQYCDQNYLKDLSFDQIDLIFYEDFKRFLFSKGCGMVGFGNQIKSLKAVMKLSKEKGLHKNDIYNHHLFKRYRGKLSNKIYLTEEEITSIESLELPFDPGLDRDRDRFLISYYFLMRFEDSRRIRKEHFFQKSGRTYLKYKQQKTGHECILPVKEKAWEILKKRNFDFSFGSNAHSNRNLKTIAAMAQITTEVKQGEITAPKWKFVTTHTARRSAATNLALQNVSIKIIADLGGWRDIDTLRNYLRASGLDSALVAKDLEFFM